MELYVLYDVFGYMKFLGGLTHVLGVIVLCLSLIYVFFSLLHCCWWWWRCDVVVS